MEAAKADLNMEHYMNPKFSASHMKFIMEQEMAGKDVTWLPIGKIPSQEHCGQTTYQRPNKKDKGKDAEGRT